MSRRSAEHDPLRVALPMDEKELRLRATQLGLSDVQIEALVQWHIRGKSFKWIGDHILRCGISRATKFVQQAAKDYDDRDFRYPYEETN